ncbi:nucleotidyltransferase family protein [Micromonospora sp. DT227]|uniref:nucleotidyltransferase family protein n=1 Tax=Micromonospora sp. DT227 TaxID=3393433 RepID=UPI003CE942FF
MTAGLAVRCLALDALAVATSDLLRRHGVDCLLLKGAGLAHRLGVDRVYGDVDLLVAPETVPAVRDALHAAGYRPTLPPEPYDVAASWHEQPFTAPGALPLTVDLHRGFAGVGDPDALWRALRGPAEPLDLAGGRVLVPDEAGTALLAALHAACPGDSDKPVHDLERALAVLPPSAWVGAGRLATRCDAVPAFTVGMRLRPAGAAVADRLGLPATAEPASMWLAARRATPTTVGLAGAVELPGPWLRRLRLLARLALPAPAYLRQADPAARGGRWRLLRAYTRRTWRHVRRLPRGVRELRTARRRHG